MKDFLYNDEYFNNKSNAMLNAFEELNSELSNILEYFDEMYEEVHNHDYMGKVSCYYDVVDEINRVKNKLDYQGDWSIVYNAISGYVADYELAADIALESKLSDVFYYKLNNFEQKYGTIDNNLGQTEEKSFLSFKYTTDKDKLSISDLVQYGSISSAMKDIYNAYKENNIDNPEVLDYDEYVEALINTGNMEYISSGKRDEELLSIGIDLIPYVGGAKTLYELYTGKDLITKRELTKGEKVFDAVVLTANVVKAGVNVVKIAEESKKFAKLSNKVKNVIKGADKAKDIAKDSSKVSEVVDGTRDVAKLSDVGVDTSKGVSKPKPYSKNRPSYRKGQVDEVWENAKDPLTGKVYDPTGKEITWDKTKPRNGQWDMGHIPGEKYSEMHKLYMDGTITKKEFLEWYKNPKNYRPELPSTNRSHKYE